MRLLIGVTPNRMSYISEFTEALGKSGVECKMVNEDEIFDVFAKRVLKWNSSMRRFNKLIKDFKPDAVLVDSPRHFGIATLKSNLPLIVYLRGNLWQENKTAMDLSDSFFTKIRLWRSRKLLHSNLNGARIIMPISKYLEEIVRAKFPNTPICTVYHGINSSTWYYESGIKLIHPCVGLVQCAASWDKTKEMLVLKDVLKKLPKVMFYWSGDGPYTYKILQELQKYPNFKWMGALDYPNDVRKFLSEIDVYAIFTGLDIAPTSLKEAMVMERPVIATNIGGIPEIMKDGKSGFLVEEGDSKGIAEKILYMLENKKNIIQMGSYGRLLVINNFSWDVIAKKFINDIRTELNLN